MPSDARGVSKKNLSLCYPRELKEFLNKNFSRFGLAVWPAMSEEINNRMIFEVVLCTIHLDVGNGGGGARSEFQEINKLRSLI